MQTLEAIHTRRSVRRYTEEPISEEMLQQLLSAAMHAPSAGNQQPWQFIVIDDFQTLAQIPDLSPYAGMCAEAPLGIVICGDLSLEKHAGYWVQDCSAATQNLLLAAHDLGLGAVWTGIFPRQSRVEGFRSLLGLPEHIVPLGFIVLGHPAEQPALTKNRFKPERIHRNGWPADEATA